ncbi:LacI family DNA-binding transcriptional regulator [Burkholderia cenocepacia]|uniref:LacI family DNA-binding transcriptional regulator n=1 Tax=Burkholderia cenocepacia TaxID=95486 RepID=UPI000F5886F2|nr:LacI family DNA-binding transcriptional regulator [Burkholderia cenocepacia]MBR8306527.1 LacI family DNA-binding transcriptional regulator [Burkholderia cenocepacia]MCF1371139.1 LacI family DNA-binding transcriptional regulator [Burkholderia cenocepacia]MCF1388618.1 LacI family DNA-binding transcriptional regulator [Burkholderia cenocepacia]MDR8028989.1 LacI family DNA-binding transcriptional regulator [Burkholderia cenocepacia]MDR8039379.1 LacI family DNA-binding transcriptional regulator 
MPSPTAVRPAGPPRMSDVARLAGVSKMTVSRVLAGHSVAAETRARVCEAIDRLGYVADAAAGALSSGRSEFVAVLVPSLSSSNFSDTVRGLTDALEPHGLQLLLGDTDYDLEREERLVRSMLRHQPRCIALTGSQHTDATRKVLERSAIPVVEMWDLPTRPIDTAVGFSNVRAARAMVRHLAERGYRRIGFLVGASELDRRGLDRLKGYQAEIKALGLGEPRVVRLGESPITMSHGGPAMAALLERWPDTDAVMCVSDMSAFGAIMECHRRGLSVPADIAVAGFGNFEVATCCHPTITTVSVDAYGIGLRTGEALLAALQARDGGEPAASKSIRIDYTIIARESA